MLFERETFFQISCNKNLLYILNLILASNIYSIVKYFGIIFYVIIASRIDINENIKS